MKWNAAEGMVDDHGHSLEPTAGAAAELEHADGSQDKTEAPATALDRLEDMMEELSEDEFLGTLFGGC